MRSWSLVWLLVLAALLDSCNCGSGDAATGDAGADGGPDSVMPAGCAALTGSGTPHTNLNGDETWTAEGSPHLIPSSLSIPQGVTVTLAPCAVVRLAAGVTFDVLGTLVSRGEADRPVRLERLVPEQAWLTLSARGGDGRPSLDLTWTIIEGGGQNRLLDQIEYDAMVRVRTTTSPATGEPAIKVDHVELRGSSSVGLLLESKTGFAPGSTALTITGSASAPVRMGGYGLTHLPDGDYSGNQVDRIILVTAEGLGVGDVPAELVMHRRNVPYRIGGYGDPETLQVGEAGSAAVTTLRIEPGAVLRFKVSGGIAVRRAGDTVSGELIAQGTAAEPITFTSDLDNPAAGDWRGIHLLGPPTAATALDHVVIAYAGSLNSQTSGFSCGTPVASNPGLIVGALTFAAGTAVTRQILTNSVIIDSASNGVDRGWTGEAVDYLATNQFIRVPSCTQTYPRPAAGNCPTSTDVLCPRVP